jgi:hypothetical protein
VTLLPEHPFLDLHYRLRTFVIFVSQGEKIVDTYDHGKNLYQWSYVSGVIRRGFQPRRMTLDTYDHWHKYVQWSYVSGVIRRGFQPRRMTPDTYDHCCCTNGRMYQVSYAEASSLAV